MHREKMENGIPRVLSKIVFVLAAFLLLSGALFFLWNALLPQLIHASIINFWQAMALLVLCRVLFGGFNFGRIISGHHKYSQGGALKDKLMAMDDADRATFKREWEKRCKQRGRQ